MPALTTTADGFLLRGEPFRIISGALRRFRVHPGEWADRLREARRTGLNTVETHVPWNMHRPEPDAGLVLDGLPDLPRHLELAAAQALHVLRDHLPAIAVQRDDEYGAFGTDTAYPNHLEQALRSHGVEKLLFICDRPEAAHLAPGGLTGPLAAGNLGGRIADSLRRLRAHRGGGPHHRRDAESAAADLEAPLAAGASVNIHMFHGATSFGLTSGASHEHAYAPAVTSYDCDAPLSESGDPTPKYRTLRQVIARHAPVPAEPPRAPVAKLPPAEAVLDRCWSRGPQRTPYVPAPVLRTGANDLVGPELHAAKGEPAHLTHVPDLGPAA